MAQHDLGAKEFFQEKKNFVSLFNGLVEGASITEEDVIGIEETVVFPDESGDGTLHEGRRDVLKRVRLRDGTVVDFILVGIENQTTIDPGMPLRAFGYDGGLYRTQYMTLPREEWVPVVTFVLYFGLTPWTGPRTLSEALKLQDRTRNLLAPYFNDYKLNLIEVAFLTEDEIKKFTGAFRLLANLYTSANKRDYAVHQEIFDNPEESIQLVRQFGFDLPPEQMEMIKKNIEQRRTTMASAFKMAFDECEQRGEQRGEERGRLEKLREIVWNMIRNNFSMEQISLATTLSPEEITSIQTEPPAGA